MTLEDAINAMAEPIVPTESTDLEVFYYLRDIVQIISDSEFGSKFILKGGTVLLSKLIEADKLMYGRRTSDIDIHCSNRDVWNKFCDKFEDLINSNTNKFSISVINRRSDAKSDFMSDSISFVLYSNDVTYRLKIDMNIKDDSLIVCNYSPILNINTYDLLTSLSDKIVVVSSQKVYRRIKDLYDIAIIIGLTSFTYDDLIKYIDRKHHNVKLTNMLTQENVTDLKHAYDKYSGIYNKPDFIFIFSIASDFLKPLYYNTEVTSWSCEAGSWVK